LAVSTKEALAQRFVRAHVMRASILRVEIETAPIALWASSSRLLGSRRAMPAQQANLRARTALLVIHALLEPSSKIASACLFVLVLTLMLFL